MDSTTTLVVKVTYGDVLRRFRVPVKANGQLDLEMAGLREKIAALFNLPLDAEFYLTYSDEDGDVVALVDDNDLIDLTNQCHKFLKINVQSNIGMRTNSIQNPISRIQKSINDVLMAVPDPMRDTISKVYMDLASKAASSSPLVGEMLDCISKLGQLSSPQESGTCSPVTRPSYGGSSCPSLSANLNKPTGFADSKTSPGLAASFNECPFSGSTVNDSSPKPINLNKPACRSKESNNGDYWTSLGVFHKGIRCDGCGVIPITGPRFKSKVKEDHDLCTICFSVMGNEEDYTRMDKPISVQHTQSLTGQFTQCPNPWLSHHVPRPSHGGLNFRCARPKLDSRFVLDVNVSDGTVVAPSAPFNKMWRMRNNGSLVWPHGTQIVWIGGDRFSKSLSVDLQIPGEGVPINSELDVKVDFVAPESPGRYISYWRMASSNGAKFGQRVWVLIHVDASLKGSAVNDFHLLKLNASPEDCSREMKVNLGTVEGGDLKGEADDLLVGDPSSTKDIPVPLEEDIEKHEVELTMLKELEEMGFKELDLIKEILRDNEYNLEQSVDALCGVSEWDPILEELQEMGFSDDVTNKRLLKKNNGSIKGVVMDLLAGEEA